MTDKTITKYSFTYEDNPADYESWDVVDQATSVTMEFSTIDEEISEIVTKFTQFLLACGFNSGEVNAYVSN